MTPDLETGAHEPVRQHDTRQLLALSAVVGLGTTISRVTGYLKVAAIAYAFGVTALAGTYSYANETPNMVYELLLGGVLTATLVPQFVRHLASRDDESSNAVITCAMLAVVALTAIGVLLAPQIVELYTLRVSGPGKAAQQALATDLVRLFLPQMIFYTFTALATALLQARQRFAAAAFAPILNNVVVIAIFVSFPQLAGGPLTVDRIRGDPALVLTLGLGTTAGVAAMALALLPALRRAGFRLRFVPAWRHAAVRAMVRLSSWSVGYVVANQVALWLVLVLANEEAGGAFAYLSAYTFFQLPHGLFAVSIMTTVTPELAAAGALSDMPALRYRFSRTLRLTLTVILPAAAVYLALARPVVVALLQRGAFTAADASLVADTLVGFAASLPFFSTYLLALRAFYALSDTRIPFLLNCFENAVNIALAFALYSWLGIPGLALAFSAAYGAAAPVTLAVLSRRIGGLRGLGIGTSALRVLVAGSAAGGSAWAVAQLIGWSTSGEAALATVAGVVAAAFVLGTIMAILRIEEFGELRQLLARRGRGRAGEGM